MAEKKTKTVRMTHANGVNVSVREDQAEALLNTGLFSKAGTSKATATSPKSSSSK